MRTAVIWDLTPYSVVKNVLTLPDHIQGRRIILHSVTCEKMVFFIAQFSTKTKALFVIFVHEKFQ